MVDAGERVDGGLGFEPFRCAQCAFDAGSDGANVGGCRGPPYRGERSLDDPFRWRDEYERSPPVEQHGSEAPHSGQSDMVVAPHWHDVVISYFSRATDGSIEGIHVGGRYAKRSQ
jgi:hypothetical protein